jgi:DNA-binding MarR family transcriptional regulator
VVADRPGASSTVPVTAATLSRGDDGSADHSVADAITDLLRTVRRSKARLLAAAGNDVESATQLLLRAVASEGPMWATTLAINVQSDLSTVSRQVATLVGRGLLERRADPLDGRATLLHVTPAGQAVITAHERTREAFFDEVLDGWDTVEQDQFARLLTRFTAAYDQTHSRWMRDAARAPTRPNDTKEGSAV